MKHRPYGRSSTQISVIALGLFAHSVFSQPVVGEKAKLASGGLYELAASPSTQTLYVASTGLRGQENAAKVLALDSATLEVKKEFDVSESPFYGLGLNERTQMLYGTSTGLGQVAVLDLESGEIVATIKAGEGGHIREAVIDEATNTIYVSSVGTRSERNPDGELSAVWVIDGSTNTLSHVIGDLPGTVTGVAVDAANRRAYVTDLAGNQISAIDLDARQVVNTWPSGGEGATNIAIDVGTGRLFVTHQESGNISVLDAKSGAVLKSVATGAGALSVAFNGNNNQIYVTNRDAGTTSVVDGVSYEMIANLETGTLPQSVAIDSKTNAVYVSNKARGLPRNAPASTPPVVDDNGDTVVLIRP